MGFSGMNTDFPPSKCQAFLSDDYHAVSFSVLRDIHLMPVIAAARRFWPPAFFDTPHGSAPLSATSSYAAENARFLRALYAFRLYAAVFFFAFLSIYAAISFAGFFTDEMIFRGFQMIAMIADYAFLRNSRQIFQPISRFDD
jgi:hypothetical protein